MTFVKNIARNKIAMLPMAIFILGLLLVKMGLLGQSTMHNPALASMGVISVPVDQEFVFSPNLLETVHVWRHSKIQRSKIYYNPDLVMTMTSSDIVSLLGQPSLVRHEGDARMMQYISDNCIADFYYIDGQSRNIEYFEVRDRYQDISLSDKTQNKKCLQKVFGTI